MQIHVLHVLNSAHGGSAISTFELIDALAKKGIRSSLVCFDNASPLQQKSIGQLVEHRVLFIPLYWMNKRIRSALWKRPVLEVLNRWRTGRGQRYQAKITAFIKEHRINIIHTSTILNPEGAIAAKANGIPHVWHVRELIGPGKHFQFYNYRKWSEFVSSHCRFLVANSKVTEQCLLQFFPQEKVKCIPNAISVASFSAVHHSNAKSKIIVGMVGNLSSRLKNHEFFIRAANVFRERQNVEFRIYGALPNDGDVYFSRMRRLIKQIDVRNLQLAPFKKPQEIMQEIDIMFHPTEFESFGRVFAEAMAAGIPIVAINEGGACEMVRHGHNGYLVPKNDIKSVEDSLNSLIADPGLRKTFGANGRRIARDHYAMERLTASVETLYRETISAYSHEGL